MSTTTPENTETANEIIERIYRENKEYSDYLEKNADFSYLDD